MNTSKILVLSSFYTIGVGSMYYWLQNTNTCSFSKDTANKRRVSDLVRATVWPIYTPLVVLNGLDKIEKSIKELDEKYSR